MEEQRRERPALSGHRSKAFLGCVVQKMKVVQQHFCDGGHIFRKPSRGHTAIMHWAKRQPITLAQANMVAKRFGVSVDEITRDREIMPELNESKKSGFAKSKT
jgi:hypothetical protein